MVNSSMGIKIGKARRWGLDNNRLEDGMTFLTLEAYAHPKTINLTMRMLDEYRCGKTISSNLRATTAGC